MGTGGAVRPSRASAGGPVAPSGPGPASRRRDRSTGRAIGTAAAGRRGGRDVQRLGGRRVGRCRARVRRRHACRRSSGRGRPSVERVAHRGGPADRRRRCAATRTCSSAGSLRNPPLTQVIVWPTTGRAGDASACRPGTGDEHASSVTTTLMCRSRRRLVAGLVDRLGRAA